MPRRVRETPPMPPPRPRVGIDVKSFYDDPTDVDWCRDGVCFVELGAASGHPDFMRRLRGVDGDKGYNPTVQESGTFLFMYAWAICVTSMTSCFVHHRELLPKRIQNFPEPSYASKDHDRLDNRLAAYGLKEKKVSFIFLFLWEIRLTPCLFTGAGRR